MSKSKKKIKKKKNFVSKIKSIFNNRDGFDLNNDSKFSIFEVIIIIFIALIFGIIMGFIIVFTNSPIKDIKSEPKISELVSVYNNIKRNYYEDLNDDELINSAIRGMIESLDDNYSLFMDEYNTNEFNRTIDGYYEGIGITIMNDNDSYYIINIAKDSPASRVGLKVNDVIIEINNRNVNNLNLEELSKLISGKKGTSISIKIRRDNEELTYSLERDTIAIETVISDIFNENNKKIGYLRVESFSSNTYSQFFNELKLLEKKNIDSLIIDLRNNSGGQINQARDILSLFFNKKTVLYQLKDSNNKKVYSKSNIKRSYPIAILVNENTASASEILLSCFMDNYKNSFSVGVKTYGKSTIQKSIKLSTGSSIKYTIDKWLTSKGSDIEGIGIEPNYEVIQSLDYIGSYDNDLQLQFALDKLK